MANILGMTVLAVAAALLSGCQPCLSSASCGAGNVCVSGVCSAQSSQTPEVGGPAVGGRPDAGVADAGTAGGGDAGTISIPLGAAPTAVALNAAGTQALVAINVDQTHQAVMKVNLPPTMPGNEQVALSGASDACQTTRLVSRGAYLYVGCDGTPAAVRAFSAASGQLVNVERPASANLRVVDHANALVMAGVPGPGGSVFTLPDNQPTTVQDVPNPMQSGQAGMALVEDSTGRVVAAVTVAPTPNLLLYHPLTPPTWGAPLMLSNPTGFVPGFITSGTRVPDGAQGVVLYDDVNNQALVYDGTDVTVAASGGVMVPIRTVTGVTHTAPVNIQASRNGSHAYYLASSQRLCRFPLSASANSTDAAECKDLPTGCSAVDVAPPSVRGAPTVVACAGLMTLHILPAF